LFYSEKLDHVFIYGGSGEKGRSMGDFSILNVRNWTWKKLLILEMPPSRHHFSFTDTGKKKKI
jgi:hypothetical protein